MTGYDAWKIHRAMLFHLTQLPYDVIEHSGRTRNSSIDDYDKFQRKRVFEFLSRNLDTPKDMVNFCLGNMAYSVLDTSFDTSSMDNMKKWIMHKESMTKYILDDIGTMNVLSDINGSPPKLIQMIAGGKILPHTAVAIDRVTPFLKRWLTENYFGLNHWSVKIIKLNTFIKYNEIKVIELIQEKISETV